MEGKNPSPTEVHPRTKRSKMDPQNSPGEDRGQQADEQKQAALLMPEYCRLVGRRQASTGPRPGWASWWYPHQQHGSAVTTAEWSGFESRTTLTPERRQSGVRSQRSSIIMNEKANGMPNPSWLDVWLKLITDERPWYEHLTERQSAAHADRMDNQDVA
ncbi:hypothetical protein MG293_006047 [Ovis ammon polii]|uniref:Uncharacterized protein n=1 Tax=Ovis ammon polii TaxID=230172 RepID=A0AAD4YCW0_OVIAM|nr:hypothetical protein MG293_006047 [Ovis ammon polii]